MYNNFLKGSICFLLIQNDLKYELYIWIKLHKWTSYITFFFYFWYVKLPAILPPIYNINIIIVSLEFIYIFSYYFYYYHPFLSFLFFHRPIIQHQVNIYLTMILKIMRAKIYRRLIIRPVLINITASYNLTQMIPFHSHKSV